MTVLINSRMKPTSGKGSQIWRQVIMAFSGILLLSLAQVKGGRPTTQRIDERVVDEDHVFLDHLTEGEVVDILCPFCKKT